jgi:hypothetical protein
VGIALEAFDKVSLPYMLFVMCTGNLKFKMPLPLCDNEDSLDGQTITVPRAGLLTFPHYPFACCPRTVSKLVRPREGSRVPGRHQDRPDQSVRSVIRRYFAADRISSRGTAGVAAIGTTTPSEPTHYNLVRAGDRQRAGRHCGGGSQYAVVAGQTPLG